MELFGGLDIGTNGVRLVLVDERLKIIHQNQAYYKTNSPAEGRAEQDPNEIYQATYRLLQEVVNKFTDDKIYLAFSSVMHSIMGVDNKGRALTPLIIWADTRARGECSNLKELYGRDFFYKNTACPLHSTYWPAKITWLKKNQTDDIKLYASIKEYLIYRLSGLWKADCAIASTSGIYNPLLNDYDSSILKKLGISRDNLSELVPTNYQFEFKVEDKSLYGIIGSTDGPLANLGSGAFRDDSIVLTAGSSSAVRFISKDLIFDKQARVWNYILDSDYYVLGEATNGAGLLLNWLAEIFSYQNAEEMIKDNLGSFPYKISNVFCVPTMMGERGPSYNEDIRGLFYGLSLNHSKQDMIISLYESIAFYLKMVFDDLQRVINPQRDFLIITGGLGTSPIFRKLLSYLIGGLNYLPEYEQSTALGSVMLAIKEIKKVSYLEQLRFLPEPSPVLVDKDNGFKQNLYNKYDRFIALYKKVSQL